jgi:seryl-tRNA(Sec) selenium transferase
MNRFRAGAADSDWQDVFRQLQVEPIINCGGVRTQWGGANPAPEVLAAMASVSQQFVDLDELADGVGRRLSELTDAPWGIVTSGTTAALALVAAACIAGNNPELMLRLPRTDGLAHRVVMLEQQRFDYDHALLCVGAEIVGARDLQHLQSLLDGSVVLICLLARREFSPSLEEIVRAASARNVPVLVDAAGLSPTKPDRWLTAGANLVVYSGGKYLRAPHSTGILLGDKSLCEAAWRNGAPHQAIGRAMKVGKEEMVGAVVALDRWLNATTAREERSQWRQRIDLICRELAGSPAISLTPIPDTSFVTAPRVRVAWDPGVIPHESGTLRTRLLDGRPRILIHDFWCGRFSVVIDPINLTDAEARLVCQALRRHLSILARTPPAEPPAPRIDVSGDWSSHLTFLHGRAQHRLLLEQRDRRITGQHIGRFSSGTLEGSVAGDHFHFVARHAHGSLPLYYEFSGHATGDQLSGTLHLGAASDEHAGPVFQRQFGAAQWFAERLTAG